jgi:hypothetical protein
MIGLDESANSVLVVGLDACDRDVALGLKREGRPDLPC